MAIRTFYFCDICNPQAIRSVELRRAPKRSSGRRISDGRSWFEGTATEATIAGWSLNGSDGHICARCRATLKETLGAHFPHSITSVARESSKPTGYDKH